MTELFSHPEFRSGGRRFSTRTMFAVVSLITGALLFGSVILQRIVFKADQASSAVFISPATVVVKPNQDTAIRIKASFDRPITLTAVQFALELDPSVVSLAAVQASVGYQTVYQAMTNGTLIWVIVPDAASGSAVSLSTETMFGELTVKGTDEGIAPITFDDSMTKIVAIDPTQTPSLYNAVTSTQAGAVTVSQSLTATPLVVDAEPATDTTTDTGSFNSIDVVTGQSAADILIGTDQPRTVSVDFGLNPEALVSTVQGRSASTYSARRLSDLTPATRYYYRVRLVGDNNETTISRVRSFTTRAATDSTLDMTVFPRQASAATVVYLSSPGTSAPSVVVTEGQATLGSITGSGGLYQVVATSKLATRQNVKLTANADPTTSIEVIFNPNLVDADRAPNLSANQPLAFSTPAKLLLGGLALGLLILTLILIRLTKVK